MNAATGSVGSSRVVVVPVSAPVGGGVGRAVPMSAPSTSSRSSGSASTCRNAFVSIEADAVLRDGGLNSYRIGGEAALLPETLWIPAGADIRRVNGARTSPWLGLTAGRSGARISLAFGFDPEENLGRQTRVTASYRF